MKPRYQVSRSAIELIKRFEGYRHQSARLADGRWTIGYGHTLTAREGAEVSEQDAEALLIYDLIAVAHSVNEWVYTPLTQNQFDALTAFAFNIGLDSFRGSSVLRRLNEGALIQAACAMELWRKAEFEGVDDEIEFGRLEVDHGSAVALRVRFVGRSAPGFTRAPSRNAGAGGSGEPRS